MYSYLMFNGAQRKEGNKVSVAEQENELKPAESDLEKLIKTRDKLIKDLTELNAGIWKMLAAVDTDSGYFDLADERFNKLQEDKSTCLKQLSKVDVEIKNKSVSVEQPPQVRAFNK